MNTAHEILVASHDSGSPAARRLLLDDDERLVLATLTRPGDELSTR
jgi:hypothetical protein